MRVGATRCQAIAVLFSLLLVGACSSDDHKNDASQGSTAATNDTTSTTQPTTATTVPNTPTVTDVFPTDSLPCQAVPAPTTPVTNLAPAGATLLTKVDVVGDDCVDHVVFELKGKAHPSPGYKVDYGTPPFTQAGSGKTVAVMGHAFVVVTISPGYGYDFESGTPTYTGPLRITPATANHVQEIAQLGDYEGTLQWVIGLDSKRPFTVQATTSPQVQLAVTIG